MGEIRLPFASSYCTIYFSCVCYLAGQYLQVYVGAAPGLLVYQSLL